MKAIVLEAIPNTGKLKNKNNENLFIEIKKGRFILKETSHPLIDEKELFYKKIYCLEHEKKHIYFLNIFGKKDNNAGIHIGLNRFEHQKFLWLQNSHWFQKEENIRYLINILFLILGVIIGFNNC